MKMKYEGTPVMPSSYVVMEQDEMSYVGGGWQYTYSTNNIAVPMKAIYLSKGVCLAFATYVVNKNGNHINCNGMGIQRIAEELYAHAIGYYSASSLQAIGLSNATINNIKEAGSVADIGLGDGLDASYMIIWNLI